MSQKTARAPRCREWYVRFGSKADICSAKGHVRFTPESGHVRCTSPCLLWANSGHLCSRVSLWRYGGKYIVGRHGATDALKRKIANWFDVDGIFNRHQDTRTNQDLPWLGFVAKTRRDIGYRSDCGV